MNKKSENSEAHDVAIMQEVLSSLSKPTCVTSCTVEGYRDWEGLAALSVSLTLKRPLRTPRPRVMLELRNFMKDVVSHGLAEKVSRFPYVSLV